MQIELGNSVGSIGERRSRTRLFRSVFVYTMQSSRDSQFCLNTRVWQTLYSDEQRNWEENFLNSRPRELTESFADLHRNVALDAKF